MKHNLTLTLNATNSESPQGQWGTRPESRTKDHPDKRPPSWFFYG